MSVVFARVSIYSVRPVSRPLRLEQACGALKHECVHKGVVSDSRAQLATTQAAKVQPLSCSEASERDAETLPPFGQDLTKLGGCEARGDSRDGGGAGGSFFPLSLAFNLKTESFDQVELGFGFATGSLVLG